MFISGRLCAESQFKVMGFSLEFRVRCQIYIKQIHVDLRETVCRAQKSVNQLCRLKVNFKIIGHGVKFLILCLLDIFLD